MHQAERGDPPVRAFTPSGELTYEADGQRGELVAGVTYLVPHALPREHAEELESQGHGWCQRGPLPSREPDPPRCA